MWGVDVDVKGPILFRSGAELDLSTYCGEVYNGLFLDNRAEGGSLNPLPG
jgi:hypothetical protein